MKSKNINNERMKIINSKIVLNYIREKKAVSRKVIAQDIGLTTSTVTNIIHELIDHGYVIETGKGDSEGGRKPVFLQLNKRAGYAIGIELNASRITCVLTNFEAEIIYKLEMDISLEEGKDKIISNIIEIIEKCLKEAEIDKEKVCGIGLVSAGPYDKKEGVMLNPPNFPGWLSVPIKDIIEKKLNIPTYFEKDTNGAAIAEFWHGKEKDIKNIFVINIYDIGIGGGVIINEQLFHGFKDGAGNIGHLSVDINGPVCKCGNKGCLETLASGTVLLEKIKSEIRNGKKSLLENQVSDVNKIDIQMMLDALNKGDKLTTEVIDTGAKYVSAAITNVINLFSPEIIVMGGNFINKCPGYKERITHYVHSQQFPPQNKEIKIVSSEFGDVQCALGGAIMALQEIFKE